MKFDSVWFYSKHIDIGIYPLENQHVPNKGTILKGNFIFQSSIFGGYSFVFRGVYIYIWYMGVSKNNGTPKSSILIGFFIISHPFWGTPIFGNIHLGSQDLFQNFNSRIWVSTSPARFPLLWPQPWEQHSACGTTSKFGPNSFLEIPGKGEVPSKESAWKENVLLLVWVWFWWFWCSLLIVIAKNNMFNRKSNLKRSVFSLPSSFTKLLSKWSTKLGSENPRLLDGWSLPS